MRPVDGWPLNSFERSVFHIYKVGPGRCQVCQQSKDKPCQKPIRRLEKFNRRLTTLKRTSRQEFVAAIFPLHSAYLTSILITDLSAKAKTAKLQHNHYTVNQFCIISMWKNLYLNIMAKIKVRWLVPVKAWNRRHFDVHTKPFNLLHIYFQLHTCV